MATDIVMPNLGFDAQEGRLIEWLKQPGDSVQKGEVLAIIESDKANVELESLASGVLLEQLFPQDTVVNVGAVIARIGKADEKVAAPQTAQKTAPAAALQAPQISPVARRLAQENRLDLSSVKGSGMGGRIMREDVEAHLKGKPNGNGGHGVLALPKVRKLAREAGIDLAQVSASGWAGQVTLRDLEAYQGGQTAPPARERIQQPAPTEGIREVALSKIRQLIGKRLGRSMRKAPHFYVTGEFDVEVALNKLAGMPAPQPRINDLLQYLTVQTLLRVPELNATYEKKHFYIHNAINLAVAIARDDGLITPVIPAADRLSLTGLAAESRALVKRARDNRLQPSDLQSGTFTISNLGVIKQVDHFTAVINPPQVAILAVGTVKARPVVIEGGLFARHTVHMTLSGDHRVVDGMHLARFMAVFQEELDRFSA